jgi:mannosyltransferase
VKRFFLIRWRLLGVICFLLLLETLYHIQSYRVPSPSLPLDAPFYTTCQQPDPNGPRANATILMLARNSDREGAVRAITSLERQFNQWYHYPVVFLNDKPWDQQFIDALSRTASGEVFFELIDSNMWGFPGWIDQNEARRKMAAQEASGLMYAGAASYHHMCRFNSG